VDRQHHAHAFGFQLFKDGAPGRVSDPENISIRGAAKQCGVSESGLRKRLQKTTDDVRKIAHHTTMENAIAAVLTGNISQAVRRKTTDSFRSSQTS
jgi:DNA transposition AAA+ family ATPase